MCVNKADGWGSVALQTRPLRGHVAAREIRGYRCPNPQSESCEVIGQFFLHGVTVMLHWLVGEAGGTGGKQT